MVQRRKQEHGATAGLHVRVATFEEPQVNVRDEDVEGHQGGAAGTDPGDNLGNRALVERGHEQAERRGREHHSGREAEQAVK